MRLELPEFENLLDNQNELLQKLLRYRIGLCQVYTGYGKSEIMATLAAYLNENKIPTLFITSSSKALEELKDRACSKFKLEDPGYFNPNLYVNFINAKGFWRSEQSKNEDNIDWLKKVKVILFDEVEQSLNDMMCFHLDTTLLGREFMYGFSATSNKSGTERLTPNSNEYYNIKNQNLVKYFGYATVHLTPSHKTMHIERYQSDLEIVIEETGKNSVINLNYVKDNLYDNPEFIREFNKFMVKYRKGTTFIPINRTQVIENLTPKLDKSLNILILSSSGYTYNGEKLSMNEAKDLVRDNKVDIFFGTRSGYNSIDFPNIKSIFLMLEEKAPNHILQAIGRSREKEVNIYCLEFKGEVPIYSKKLKHQLQMIKDYYKLSKVNEIKRLML